MQISDAGSKSGKQIGCFALSHIESYVFLGVTIFEYRSQAGHHSAGGSTIPARFKREMVNLSDHLVYSAHIAASSGFRRFTRTANSFSICAYRGTSRRSRTATKYAATRRSRSSVTSSRTSDTSCTAVQLLYV